MKETFPKHIKTDYRLQELRKKRDENEKNPERISYRENLEKKIFNLENLSFRDHIDGTEKQSSIYVSHQTSASALIGIVREKGILVDPTALPDANQFVCTEVYTHPMIAKKRVGYDFADILERNFEHERAIQHSDTEKAYYIDHLVVIRDHFPVFFRLIKEKMQELYQDFPDIFLFRDDGNDFLWQRQTVAEFIAPKRQEEASNRVAKIVEELVHKYEQTVRPHLSKKQIESVTWPRPTEDERMYVNKIVRDYEKKYNLKFNQKENNAFLSRIAMLFAKGSLSQPTYYDAEHTGITLLIELDNDLIDIQEARKGNFSTKSVVVDQQGSFIISPDATNERGSKVLPLRHIKAIVSQSTSPEAVRTAITKLARAFRGRPADCIPLYDGFGNMIWPEKIPHDRIVSKLESAKMQ